MNIKMGGETLLQQLRRIVETMRASGRKPLRIHLTWGQLETLRAELQSQYNLSPIQAHKMELLGIPLELTPPGSGLWVSCISEIERGKSC